MKNDKPVTNESCLAAIEAYLTIRTEKASMTDIEDNAARIKAKSALRTIAKHLPKFQEKLSAIS